jgi:hypothetical protein
MRHCEPLPAKDLVLFQFQHPSPRLGQIFCGQNPDLEDSLTLVLELNYSLGNLIGAHVGIRTPNPLTRSWPVNLSFQLPKNHLYLPILTMCWRSSRKSNALFIDLKNQVLHNILKASKLNE